MRRLRRRRDSITLKAKEMDSVRKNSVCAQHEPYQIITIIRFKGGLTLT